MSTIKFHLKSFLKRPLLKENFVAEKVSLSSIPSKSFLKHEISKSLLNLVMWPLFQPIRTLEILKLCEISWDLLKKYFHLKSNAVYNSSAKNWVIEGKRNQKLLSQNTIEFVMWTLRWQNLSLRPSSIRDLKRWPQTLGFSLSTKWFNFKVTFIKRQKLLNKWRLTKDGAVFTDASGYRDFISCDHLRLTDKHVGEVAVNSRWRHVFRYVRTRWFTCGREERSNWRTSTRYTEWRHSATRRCCRTAGILATRGTRMYNTGVSTTCVIHRASVVSVSVNA